MPFKSKAQRRLFYAMANRGEISHEKVKHWENATHGKKLPERVKKAVEAAAIKLAPAAPSPPLAPAVAIAAAPTIAKLKAQAIYKVSSIEHDEIPGGKADEAHDSEFDPKQLAMGERIEREHTKSPAIAKEIAEDHLKEFGHYYTALRRMENKLEEGKTAAYVLGVQTAFIKLGARITETQMREALKTMKPYLSRLGYGMFGIPKDISPSELRKLYRGAFNPEVAKDLPLRTRLESYKHWKRTGRLPSISGGKVDPYTSFPYEYSNEPITLYSGGTTEGFRHATRKADAGFTAPFVLPGQTQPTYRGMWATRPASTPQGVEQALDQSRAYAEAAMGLGRLDTSPGAVAAIKIPRKHVVYNTRSELGSNATEAMIPPDPFSRAETSIIERVRPRTHSSSIVDVTPDGKVLPRPAPPPPRSAPPPSTPPTSKTLPTVTATKPPRRLTFAEEQAQRMREFDLDQLRKFRGDHARLLSDARIRELLGPEAEKMLVEKQKAEAATQALLKRRF